MKEIAIETERRPLTKWLPRENSDEVVRLTRGGRIRFILVPFDDGDEEVLAIRKNKRLMAYIEECVQRARRGPTKSLEEIEEELGLAKKKKKKR
jgi:hypothetical protein